MIFRPAFRSAATGCACLFSSGSPFGKIRPSLSRDPDKFLMARTAAFRSFVRLMTAALLADRRRCSVVDAVGMLREQTQNTPAISRRRFLFGAGATGTTLALGMITGFPLRITDAKPLSSSLSVGIVGAGLAGLACADTLKTRGVRASIYEATTRAGGRCRSLRGFFPGQVAECGGELSILPIRLYWDMPNDSAWSSKTTTINPVRRSIISSGNGSRNARSWPSFAISCRSRGSI